MPGSAKIPIGFTGAPETMLATLHARALDADADKPFLGDAFAKDLVSRIDYNWHKTGVTARNASAGTVRTMYFDNRARQFLAEHDRAVVLHLGCGLDDRVLRLDPGPDVEWYDVDYPDVIALVEQLFPARAHYHAVAASVTDPAWLGAIPADRPALLIAEGLTYYLTRDDGIALLRRVVEHFPSGELHFDVCNWLSIQIQKVNPVVRRSGSTLHWAVNEPNDILHAVPGVQLLEAISVFDTDEFKRLPSGGYRALGKMMRAAPTLRNVAQFHRYAFRADLKTPAT
ncbi:MAG TPA: class I SAM-dependent methyltransferase [Mycobacterium sp.]|nr:class I SAM-dependent methyltransferase [Mycobacterium sp.]